MQGLYYLTDFFKFIYMVYIYNIQNLYKSLLYIYKKFYKYKLLQIFHLKCLLYIVLIEKKYMILSPLLLSTILIV